jgi:bifunctional NMN adenylyltransferase/nudix hydrolase
MHDYAVYIGRFQPFHDGHRETLKRALSMARQVILLKGSSNLHISPKNPWSYDECKRYIEYNIDDLDAKGRIIIRDLNDVPYNDTAWQTQVRGIVEAVIGRPNADVALIGFNKDPSTYYLDMFPEWSKINVQNQYGTINATGIRKQFFQETPIISEFLSQKVRAALKGYAFTPEFKWLLNEVKFLDGYQKEWGQGPFITTDSVATQSGHILLIRRKFPPYAGALALPGGFVNQYERIIDGTVRELKEETRIADQHGEIPAGKLRSFITGTEIFDDPGRDPRGRLVTHASRFIFPDAKERWTVRGDDDAEHAQWHSLHELDPTQFMADHWFIIQKMTGISWK